MKDDYLEVILLTCFAGFASGLVKNPMNLWYTHKMSMGLLFFWVSEINVVFILGESSDTYTNPMDPMGHMGVVDDGESA